MQVINEATGKVYSRQLLFCYNAPSGSLIATTGNSQIPINFANDSDFLVTQIKTLGNTGVTVQLQLESAAYFSTAPMFTSAIASSANGVDYRDKQVIIPKGTKMFAFFFNGDGSAHSDEIQIWGLKLFE